MLLQYPTRRGRRLQDAEGQLDLTGGNTRDRLDLLWTWKEV